MVAHSDCKYQCKEMSDCPYTGTTVIEKIPWAGEAGANQEEDLVEESDTNKEDGLPKYPNSEETWIS